MANQMTWQEAWEKWKELTQKGWHCAPAMMEVMRPIYGIKSENYIWPTWAFGGGIGNFQSVCGIFTGPMIALGFCYGEKAQEGKISTRAARDKVYTLADEFMHAMRDKFGVVDCRAITGYDFRDPEMAKEFNESGRWKYSCFRAAEYAFKKLFEMKEREDRKEAKEERR